ncbi:protein kinase domain-containing protein [Mariniblastus fucicola]|uniref:Serine/threonine-protein kinase PrkC n=1 Tax=Mariniblastus fucicola TaxID=980251 RepID=A0A5B9PSD3_9BACT|nr:protein kinase [Mariniblastus fucicola]QEG25133.1 Serine/threonine-protein kinase PrkC [Mariniblastus fucicola]
MPKFCSHCGSQFDSVTDGVGTSGVTSGGTPDQTIGSPNQSSQNLSLENTHDSSFVIRPAEFAGKLKPGSRIGPFKLGCQLGAGGMGTVYEAHDTDSDCPVALKILSKQVRTTEEGVERFRRESQVAASINHPGSTFVYRSGQYGDQFFIAMELMNGGTLKDIVEEEGPLEVSRAVDFMIQAIDGLAVAHEAGIVHRDFKPSNCFLDDDGGAKVGDFGLAKNFFGDVALTQTGAFVGTPQFAAPEQLRAGHVDARTDIYAVGGTLFYLLTGRAPFVGDAAQVISGIAAVPAPNVKTIAPHVPEKLASLLASMLEKDPERRPGSVQEIRAALLPFSSLGAVAPDNGLRMAAFFIDMFIFGFVGIVLSLTISPLAMILGAFEANLITAVVNFIAVVGWFAVQEYVLGTTIGKWLFRMRVINDQNDTPKLWQALVRPLFIPGSRAMMAFLPVFFLESPEGGQTMSAQDVVKIGLVELFSFLAWIPSLLFMLTGRISNGYRGIHDLVTGTRVVRISNSLETAQTSNQPVTAPLEVDPTSFPADVIEPFRILGQLGINARTGERILIGEDPQLDRKVWIYETTEANPPLSRAGIRPTRQRIIASRVDTSSDPQRRYFVAESIEGMPWLQLLESGEVVQWTTLRPLLRELASELDHSANEDSLPDHFGPENVWLDRSGQLKFVEIATGEETSTMNAREVFELFFEKIVANHPVPEHVIELNQKWRKSTNISMSEIDHKLEELVDRPSGWSWIDRIGATCVSLAIELSILFLLGQAWLSLCKTQFNLGIGIICGLFFVMMLAGSIVTGYFFESPTFWFLGITARNRNKQHKPSRIRLAVRMALSWLLPILMATTFVGLQAAALSIDPEGPPPFGFLIVVLAFPAVVIAMLIVTLFNLASPSRGVADFLSGTLLMRK